MGNPMDKDLSGFQKMIKHLFYYPVKGLVVSVREELSLIRIISIGTLLVVTNIYFNFPMWQIWMLVGFLVLAFAIELLNTAIEGAVDMITTDYDINAGKVKDAGAAAQFVMWCLVFIFYGYMLWPFIF